MDITDIEKGIAMAAEFLTENPEIQIEIDDEPFFIRRLVGKFKAANGKDCTVLVYFSTYDDIKDLRIYTRGIKNWAMIRKIPFHDLENSIKGPGIK